MILKYKKFYRDYFNIRNEIDSSSEQLAEKHSKHMECKAGCDLCCMDYSIFPVEFYSILNQLKKNSIKPEIKTSGSKEECIFLFNHRCTMYTERPVICRTHGLPLLYMNDNSEWELSACELNFTTFNMEQFDEKNTFPQDTFNSKLFMLNKEFIKKFMEVKYNEFDLIPVKNLIDYL